MISSTPLTASSNTTGMIVSGGSAQLEASRMAHERARRLDPTIKTSIAYTSAVAGDYDRAADEARDNEDPFQGVALALAGRTSEAIGLLVDLQGRYGSNKRPSPTDWQPKCILQCWRLPMKSLSWINFLLGVWLTVAAFVLPARPGPVMAAESAAGVIIAVLAYASAVARPNAAISWSVAAAGLWTLIVSYGAHTAATSNASIVGLAVLVLGSANAIYRHAPKRVNAPRHRF